MAFKGLFSRRSRRQSGKQDGNQGGGQGQAEQAHNNNARTGAQSAPMGYARINVDFLNVRSTPNGAKVGQVSNGQQLEVVGRNGNWLQIKHEGGHAFVYAKYTTYTPIPRRKPQRQGAGQEAAIPRAIPVEEDDIPKAIVVAEDRPEEVMPESGEKRPGLLARIFGRNKKKQGQGGGRQAERQPSGMRELNKMLSRGNLSTKEVQRARAMIEALPEERQGDAYESLQAAIPYASQRDNTSVGGKDDRSSRKGKNIGDVMCNVTSLAMVLQTLGVPNPHPEMQYEDALERVRRDRNLPKRTTQGGWSGIARALGVKVKMLAGHGKRSKTFWTSNVRNALRSGSGVMMSIDGHIMKVQGVNSQGVVVDDPFGKSVLQGSKYGFSAVNAKGKKSEVGNDHTWPWPMVLNHTHHWVAEFSK